ncbi:uncharacterized isoform X2 [Zea mays]|uniref:uncharacterized isoform X2 n=1 Tax=Zea mays TaxID=4577 RepID=UPI0004DE7E4C|nr:uncharacterized protein LOC100502149 isoform X2 [Zea mays]|eukprot:XP_008677735.1 uncharacterized LOC100502149 isoform X4 [Zea mays]
MATDALALMDHLGWKKAHVFGHSMGAMIACKLDVMAPHRLCSLALLNVTRGGFQCFPKVDAQMLSLAFRFLRAKTPEERALVDLETHYTKVFLPCLGCAHYLQRTQGSRRKIPKTQKILDWTADNEQPVVPECVAEDLPEQQPSEGVEGGRVDAGVVEGV